ncbi:CarD family transcriptional regulator [soil metagenome]
MELIVGQKVSYPNQGVCMIEDIEKKKIGKKLMQFYSLRVLSDNSIIFVPMANAETVGLRPVISSKQYKNLMEFLAEDFGEVSDDWKIRSREFNEKLQSGDVFEAAKVLKKLTFLSHEKKLSFREQSFLEKAKFLILSEITNVGFVKKRNLEAKIDELIETACRKHLVSQPKVSKAIGH